jgi:hypothetical protein
LTIVSNILKKLEIYYFLNKRPGNVLQNIPSSKYFSHKMGKNHHKKVSLREPGILLVMDARYTMKL